MEEIVKFKQGATLQRWQTAIKDKAFDSVRDFPLLETQAEHLLRVLEIGTVSTNVHLRKLHNFCMDMNWLPWPSVAVKKRWPAIRFKLRSGLSPWRNIRPSLHERPTVNAGISTNSHGTWVRRNLTLRFWKPRM